MFIVVDVVDPQAVFHICSGFCSAQTCLGLINFQCVQCPGCFQLDHCTVFHTDESESGIFYTEFLRIPVSKGISLIGLVSQFVEGLSCYRLYFIVIHHP